MCRGATVESTEHFLLHCRHWQRRRGELWSAIRAAPAVVRCPAVWHTIQRALADPTASDNGEVLLRVILEGDLSDAMHMPDGYGSSPTEEDLSASEIRAAEAHRDVSTVVTRFLTTVVAARKQTHVRVAAAATAAARSGRRSAVGAAAPAG